MTQKYLEGQTCTLDTRISQIANIQGIAQAICDVTGDNVTDSVLGQFGDMSLQQLGQKQGWTDVELEKIIGYANGVKAE